MNVEVFFTLADVRDKLERWRQDYNQVRPHSAWPTILLRHSRPDRQKPRRSVRNQIRTD